MKTHLLFVLFRLSILASAQETKIIPNYIPISRANAAVIFCHKLHEFYLLSANSCNIITSEFVLIRDPEASGRGCFFIFLTDAFALFP